MPTLAELKSDFATRNFSSLDYTPPTGIGNFDIDYRPGTSLVHVKVKANFNFLGPADDPSYLTWKFSEQVKYKNKALAVVKNAWSNKYKFVCTDPDWSNLVANVKIEMVEAGQQNCHYILDSRKVKASASDAWSGGCDHSTAKPYHANFSNWGVETRVGFKGEPVFNYMRKQLNERLKFHGVKTLAMASGSGALTTQDSAKLLAFAADAKQILGDDATGIHCYIYGSSTETVLNRRGSERADAVYKLLKDRVPNFFKVVNRSTTSTSKAKEVLANHSQTYGQFSGVVLYIEAANSSAPCVHTNYIILTHEFGHMLGCPDEYYGIACTGIRDFMALNDLVPAVSQGLNTDAKRAPLLPGQTWRNETVLPGQKSNQLDQQKGFAEMLDATGVASPAFIPMQNSVTRQAKIDAGNNKFYSDRAAAKQQFGPNSKQYKKIQAAGNLVQAKTGATNSIMFTGQRILTAHYLPIWAALGELTQNYFDPTAWQIEPA